MGPVSDGVHYFSEHMTGDFWTPPVAIAHRGSRLLWPENTMAAFSSAYSLGFRHLETDLHLTSDGVLVCIHDHTVDRTTDGTGPVASFTLAELSNLDAGFRHGPGFDFRAGDATVPSLEELVTSFPDAGIVVDLKIDGLSRPLVDLIDRLDLHERLIVGSFHDSRLAEFRAASGGRVKTSVGSASTRAWLLSSRVGRAPSSEAAALQLPRRSRGLRVVDRRLIETAHRRGVQVHVWTINVPDEMNELLDMGVDGLVTDRPDLLKQVLIDRGEWAGTPD
jgi:glycerophosphoryl diester phosphodiesterase